MASSEPTAYPAIDPTYWAGTVGVWSQFASLQSKDMFCCNQGVLVVEVGHAALDD